MLGLHLRRKRSRAWAWAALACGVCSLLNPAQSFAQASTDRPVTIKEYNQLLRYTKSLAEKVKKLESSASSSSGGSGATEETVDLSQMGSSDGASSSSGKSRSGSPHGAPIGGAPQFKVYFDFNMLSRPGVNDFTFDNFHSFLMFESSPVPEWSFSFEVNPTPRYYEASYHPSTRWEVRAGKVWIPFDDLAPHNIFGGRVNVSRLALGEAFLPDLWTDLGVAGKYRIVDSKSFTLDAHLYVLNGFASGGSDPLGVDTDYPSFSDRALVPDNNTNKAFGGRVAMKAFQKFGLGLSYYHGRWSDEDDVAWGVRMIGTDTQVRLGSTELRAGLVTMTAELASGEFYRGGSYVELGQKFGKRDQWKVLLRGGTVQPDDRVISVTDQRIVGATLLYQPGFIQYSIEHSRDIQDVPGKVGQSFTNARVVVAL